MEAENANALELIGIISLIILIVGSVLMAVFYMSDKNKKIIQSMPIEKLKLKLKFSRNFIIVILILFLISSFMWIFHAGSFNIGSLFLALFPIYIHILDICIVKRILKQKAQEELLTD